MPVDKTTTVTFRLWPIAALLKKGHRLRVAIAGADADTFARIPAKKETTLRVARGGSLPSFVEIPVIEGGLKK